LGCGDLTLQRCKVRQELFADRAYILKHFISLLKSTRSYYVDGTMLIRVLAI
jgi:hypothetical protein